MGVQLQILTEDERQKIHEESIKILEEIGTKFLSDKALKILADNGAKVDKNSKIVRIPREMVDQALKTAPKSFVLGGRDPKFDVTLPTQQSGYVLDLGGVFTIDFKTGERRDAVEMDTYEAYRVFEEMSLGSLVWPHSIGAGAGEHADASGVRMGLNSIMWTGMHVQDEMDDPSEVPHMIEGLTAILGSEDAVRKRKIYSVCYCTLAPLVHAGNMCDAYLELIKFEVPILIFPMPCPGSTAPSSLFSSIAMGNAEALSSLVIFQMAQPGTPMIYGDASGSTEFSTGGFLEGSPEMVLQTAARGEMAKFYGLPDTQGGCLADAKEPGVQAVIEKMITTMPLVLNGTDLIQGPGGLESSNCLCLEQIVVDNEIAELCKRIKDGVDMSAAKNYFDDIKRVQPGGHFLTEPNTLKACRSDEFYMPRLCDRNTYERWFELGRPDVYKKAREKVEEILSKPQKNPLPDDIIGKLEDIMRRADAAL